MYSIHEAERPPDVVGAEDHILVVIGHPDDETVLHGQYIQDAIAKGADVHVAAATTGNESTINARFWVPGFVRCGGRRHEAASAAQRLGIPEQNLHFLHVTDGEVHQHLDALTYWLGGLMLAHNITKAVTPGPDGYDKHPDHIAADAAAMAAAGLAKAQGKAITLLRLDARGQGELQLPVDTANKIWATLAHFSQFPGFRLFGKLWLPRRTKCYLAKYADLVYGAETYRVDFAQNTV